MAEGRTVLFVAEKAAALDVVKQRIDAAGLGPFALDIHDRASKPAQIRKQLLEALELRIEHDHIGHDVATDDLRRRVASLRGYTERLHQRGPLGLTAYHAREQMLAQGSGPTIPIPQKFVLSRGVDTLRRLKAATAGLHDLGQPTRPAPDHPWAFLNAPRARDLRHLDDDAVADAVRAVDDALAAAGSRPHAAQSVLAEARQASDLALLANVLMPGTPGLDVLDQAVGQRWRQAADDLEGRLTHLARSVDEHQAATPVLWTMPVDDLMRRAREAQAASIFSRGKRLKALIPELAPGSPGEVTKKEVVATAERFVQVRDAARAARDVAASMPGLDVPASWNPLDAKDRSRLLDQLHWIRIQATALADTEEPFATRLRELLALPERERRYDGSELHALARAVASLHEMLGVDDDEWSAWLQGRPFVDRWAESSVRRTRDVDRAPADAVRWRVAFVDAVRPFAEAGLHDSYRDLLTGAIPADRADEALERGTAAAVLEERLVSEGFAEFDAEQHERVIDSFVRLAPEVRDLQATALPARLLASRSFDPTRASGRIGELRRELAKERRGKSIRGLVEEFGDLILGVTPCVLVSPASLARFFPPGAVTFDMVVFDEASQIRVADAVGAMGRGRSVVVVGDSKQMPPSTIMETSVIADDEDSLPEGAERVAEDLESILSECVEAQVPQRMLTWHYRSEDESLIAFSNANFYDGKLSSFPGPSGRRPGFGVHLRLVDGHFHRPGDKRPDDGPQRTNMIEARAVVAEIIRRFRDAGGERPSLGVVTFNLQQRDLINDLLLKSSVEAVVDAVEEDGPASLFVKNLENVQGDERDTILFSTGFSVNAKGVLPLNFGPLNLSGGERRLNVAVTRARREVVIFSSFAPELLRAEDTSARGIKLLRAYLDMAARGVESSGDTVGRTSQARDWHRGDVAQRLRDRGWRVTTDVGLSHFRVDLAVTSPDAPDRALLAVLLDGPTWASRRTVGDRDGLPVEVLRRRMGWPAVARVWLPSWLQDHEAVLDRLDAMLQQTGTVTPRPTASENPDDVVLLNDFVHGAPGSEAPVSDAVLSRIMRSADPVAASPSRPPVTALTQTGPIVVEEFRPWTPGVVGTVDMLDDPGYRSRVRRAVADCLEAEAPIRAVRLAKAVGGAFGLTRVQQSRAEGLVSLIPRDARIDRDEVVWRGDQLPDEWLLVRRSDDVIARPLDHVPLREIGNAMVLEAIAAAGLNEEKLYRTTLANFGGKRLTDGIRARLHSALRAIAKEGRLFDTNGRWRAL